MLSQIWKRSLRAPKLAAGVLAFGLLLSLALCGLDYANRMEVENYQQAYRTVPVTLTATNLTGVKTDKLELPRWAVNVFSGAYAANDTLEDYIKDVKLKMTLDARNVTVNGQEKSVAFAVGLSQLEADSRFTASEARRITWFPGYGEEVLGTAEMVCVVPEGWLNGELSGAVDMVFSHTEAFPPPGVTQTKEISLQVVGTHQLEEDQVFLPYAVVENICSAIGRELSVDCASATLKDNNDLESVRQMARSWFAEPNLKAEKTPWDYSWYSYYPFALKIDDSQLKNAAQTMENSILMNQICTVLVFVLAAGASFFVGFLMIRSRKKEIILMRTMGTPAYGIFGSFALEQLACVVLGVVLGGAAFLWRPLEQLLLFVVIYALGLTLALLVFLRKNLMATMKEDE